LKRVSKSESVLHFHNGLLPNECDGMSAITLHFPSMCMGVSGHACYILRCIARGCTRCLATIDPFDARRVAQPINRELLQNNVIRFSWSGPHIPSIASHNISRPAISRSEFEMVPIQYCDVLMFAWIFSGHCHLNTVGVRTDSSPKTTPPMP
jgi:hypothetical protein